MRTLHRNIMTFDDIRLAIITLTMVNGEYKSGKMNSNKCDLLKLNIDKFEIPGFTTRSEKIFAFLNNLCEAPKCVCGNRVKISSNQKIQKFCSAKCSATSESTKTKRASTNLKLYGGGAPMCDRGILKKTQETNIEKYGTPSSWASGAVRTKAALTNLERYGIENPAKARSVRDKISQTQQAHTDEQRAEKQIRTIQTNLEKYGVERAVLTQGTKEKLSKAIIDGWAERHLETYLQHVYEKNEVLPLFDTWVGQDRKYSWKHEVCGKTFEKIVRGDRGILCPYCRRKSKVQQKVEDFVEETGLHYIVEDRTELKPFELDILIPEKKVAIEVNGIWWHHENSTQRPLLWKTDNYAGLLLHFWDFEIDERPEIVRTMIRSKLGQLPRVFARKTKVVEIGATLAKAFFEKHHLQGHASASVYLGLEYNGELISLASFGKPRFKSKAGHTWELIRFASAEVAVVGGLSKLLSRFSQGREGQMLLTFADRRFSTGNAYIKTNFKFIGKTAPNYFYFKGGQRLPRWRAMKHKLIHIVKDYDKNMSERELMFRDGWRKCSDSGNLKFELLLC